MPALLAVDLGLHTGLALFGDDGRLRWARSHHIGSLPQLRRAVPALLRATPDATHLLLEGGGPLADVWTREGRRLALDVDQVSAEEWRRDLLYVREQRSGPNAKHSAGVLARRVFEWSGLPPPKTLRHDTAEAILLGLWGAVRLHWLETLPQALRRTV